MTRAPPHRYSEGLDDAKVLAPIAALLELYPRDIAGIERHVSSRPG